MTLHGTVASPASSCDCCLTEKLSARSWRWLPITALFLPPETAKGADYVPQELRPSGSVLAHLLFNIFISDLPTTVSRKYACADDLRIVDADGDWQAVEVVLCKP